MKKKISILLMILGFSSISNAAFEVYFGMPLSTSRMNDSQPPLQYNHQTIFDFALSLTFKPVLKMGNLRLGLIGEWAWIGHSTLIEAAGTSLTTASYRFERNRFIGGGLIGYTFGASNFGFQFEYYPYLSGPVTYSDENSANPFRKGNILAGNGYGVGLVFAPGKFRLSTIFRQLRINKADMNTTSHSLPDSQYSAWDSFEAGLQIGFAIGGDSGGGSKGGD